MSLRPIFTAFTATLLLAACGTVRTGASSTAAARTRLTLTAPTGVRSTTLAAGEYVVTFARSEPCRSHELNLRKELRLRVPAGELPEVLVSAVGDVPDDRSQPQLCFADPAPSQGALVLKVDRPTRVAATGSLLVAAVERLVGKEAVAGYDAQPLAAGRYVVELTGTAQCRNQELNVLKSLAAGDGAGLTVALAAAGSVPDDLIRPMICFAKATASATVYLPLGEAATVATRLSGDLRVAGVSRLTDVEPVPLR